MIARAQPVPTRPPHRVARVSRTARRHAPASPSSPTPSTCTSSCWTSSGASGRVPLPCARHRRRRSSGTSVRGPSAAALRADSARAHRPAADGPPDGRVLHRFDALDAPEFQLVRDLGRAASCSRSAGRRRPPWYRRTARPRTPARRRRQRDGRRTKRWTRCWRWRCGRSCPDAPKCSSRGPSSATWTHALLRAVRRRAGSRHARRAGRSPSGVRPLPAAVALRRRSPARSAATRSRARSRRSDERRPVSRLRLRRVPALPEGVRRAPRVAAGVMPTFDGVAMLPLDAAAMQRGYRRRRSRTNKRRSEAAS